MHCVLEIEWEQSPRQGEFRLVNGSIKHLEVIAGLASIDGFQFSTREPGLLRLRLTLDISSARYGAGCPLLTLLAEGASFSFFASEVSESFPLFLRDYRVAVLPGGSSLTYQELAQRFSAPSFQTQLGRVERDPESSYEQAASRTQQMSCETVLGLSRDCRMFAISPDGETILVTSSLRFRPRRFQIPIGRGKGPRHDFQRRLDEGCLPVLQATKVDETISYHLTAFATLIRVPLTEEQVTGTHYLVAEHGLGDVPTPRTTQLRQAAEQEERQNPAEPLMLIYRLQARNTGDVPRPAFFYVPTLLEGDETAQLLTLESDGNLGAYGCIYASARIQHEPWTQQQIAITLQPGEVCAAEYRLLHEPCDASQLISLWSRSFEQALEEARAYWQRKLQRASQFQVPEQRLNEMTRAGLLHLDLLTYGKRQGPLTPTVGWYSAQGSESAPIIQYYDTVGWHDVARRCLHSFLEKQRDDGCFQMYERFMIETGPVLWTMGEHYRYTRDDAWVQSVASHLHKACAWIIEQRRAENPGDAASGAGLLVGNVADPEDPYPHFMLNGYHYVGLKRAAEMLQATDATASARYAQEAEAFRQAIRQALKQAFTRSPAVLLSDGRSIPSCPPWAGGRGHMAMGLEGNVSYTHQTVYGRDSNLGPLYTIFTEVLDPEEQMAQWLLEAHYEYMCQEGLAFSQPYYSCHPQLHLRRGEIKTFLKAFYSGIASLADRETYTFWEHLYGESPHKTHEEAWFLMQVRWMLYYEEHQTLWLLRGVPRAYFAHGNTIEIIGAKSYFGPLTLWLESRVNQGEVRIRVRCPEGRTRGLQRMAIRVPHPAGHRATQVRGADSYEAEREMIWIGEPEADLVLVY